MPTSDMEWKMGALKNYLSELEQLRDQKDFALVKLRNEIANLKADIRKTKKLIEAGRDRLAVRSATGIDMHVEDSKGNPHTVPLVSWDTEPDPVREPRRHAEWKRQQESRS